MSLPRAVTSRCVTSQSPSLSGEACQTSGNGYSHTTTCTLERSISQPSLSHSSRNHLKSDSDSFRTYRLAWSVRTTLLLGRKRQKNATSDFHLYFHLYFCFFRLFVFYFFFFFSFIHQLFFDYFTIFWCRVSGGLRLLPLQHCFKCFQNFQIFRIFFRFVSWEDQALSEYT